MQRASHNVAFTRCWLAAYLGPPDILTTDAGSNFTAKEFVDEAKKMGIHCQAVPTEAHNSIGKVERYHQPLRHAWNCLYQDLHKAGFKAKPRITVGPGQSEDFNGARITHGTDGSVTIRQKGQSDKLISVQAGDTSAYLEQRA